MTAITTSSMNYLRFIVAALLLLASTTNATDTTADINADTGMSTVNTSTGPTVTGKIVSCSG